MDTKYLADSSGFRILNIMKLLSFDQSKPPPTIEFNSVSLFSSLPSALDIYRLVFPSLVDTYARSFLSGEKTAPSLSMAGAVISTVVSLAIVYSNHLTNGVPLELGPLN